MKLVYLANIRLPTEKANGVQIMKMCEAFARAGVDVELVVPRRRTHINEDPFVYYGVEENFSLRKLPTIDLVGTIPRLGFWVESVVFSLFSLLYLWKHSADVIYSRNNIELYFLSFLKERLYWEPHVGSWNFVVRRVLKKVEGVIAINQGGKDYFAERGVDRTDIIVAHDAVDLDDFDVEVSREEARERLGLPQGKKIAMYIGLFDEWKGYKVLLKAAADLEKAGILVVMVGGREEQVERLKVEYPHVHFTGYRPYTELPINQRAADVLVIPNSAKSTVSTTFTSPLKLFAYMASGRPIVAADLPSMREVLSDGENAVMFEPDNPDALGAAIQKVLTDTSLAQRISRQALENVQEYTWQKRAQNILKFTSPKNT